MKRTGYLLLFFLTLYVTSCGDTNKVMPSRQGSLGNDIEPMRTLKVDGGVYVIGWQLEVNDSINHRWSKKELVKQESKDAQSSLAELESDNAQATNDSLESSVTHRKIIGYHATTDPKTGRVVTTPVYEDDKKK